MKWSLDQVIGGVERYVYSPSFAPRQVATTTGLPSTVSRIIDQHHIFRDLLAPLARLLATDATRDAAFFVFQGEFQVHTSPVAKGVMPQGECFHRDLMKLIARLLVCETELDDQRAVVADACPLPCYVAVATVVCPPSVEIGFGVDDESTFCVVCC